MSLNVNDFFVVVNLMNVTHPRYEEAKRVYDSLYVLRKSIDERSSKHYHTDRSKTAMYIIDCSAKLGALRTLAYEIKIPTLKLMSVEYAPVLEKNIAKCFYCTKTDDKNSFTQQRRDAIERYRQIAAFIRALE